MFGLGPDQFSGIPYLIQSTGYPLTVSLAAVFSFFGFDLAIARIFMLALMAVFLIALFYSAKIVRRWKCHSFIAINSNIFFFMLVEDRGRGNSRFYFIDCGHIFLAD